MLRVSDSNFTSELHLKRKTNPLNFYEDNLQYFDNDGFELNGLELSYYKDNGVGITDCLNHPADQKQWFICEDKNFKIDHSILLQRWDFADYAREQLLDYKNQFPQLNKYLKLKHKWGFDFSLEYYNGDDVIEVLHIENDFKSYELALEAKKRVETKILNTDWINFVNNLKRKKSDWEYLPAMAQNDWKASYWGFKKAEITYKAFV